MNRTGTQVLRFTGSNSTFWIFLLVIGSVNLNAQNQTYFGGGITLSSATTVDDPNIFHITGPLFIDGGGYDVTIRQKINKFLSIETGISAINFMQDFIYQELYVDLGGFISHRVPLKVELQVDAIKNRIAFYASFGYQFCIPSRTSHGVRTSYANDRSLEFTQTYISEQWFHSLYNLGIGSRFRIIDELLFEIELGYAFRVSDLFEYDFTYLNPPSQPVHFVIEEPMDYWYLQFGFSYSIQRIIDGIRLLNHS